MSTTHDTIQNPAPTRTVQLTSKRLKVHYAASVLMAIVGFIMLGSSMSQSAGNQTNPGEPSVAGILLAVMGALWMIVTKIRIWWNHG